MTKLCPFCTLPQARIREENAHALWIRDAFPISPGHSLVIPKRHLGSFFETTAEERDALFYLLERAKEAADAEYQPDGYNIGINVGVAAATASFPFGGQKESFFGDLHGQGLDSIEFFTDKKVLIERWL